MLRDLGKDAELMGPRVAGVRVIRPGDGDVSGVISTL